MKVYNWFPTLLVQRYLAANFIWPFVFSCLFFVAFLLTFQLFRIIRIMTSKGIEWASIFELIVHISVSFLPMAIPLSVLFAAIYTMNRMSEDSELVAMRSFGLTKRNLLVPFMFLGLVIAALIFVLNTNLIPHSKTQFKNTLIRLTSQGLRADIKPGQFFTEIPGVILFAEEVSKDTTKLKQVFIYMDKDSEQVISAKRGALIKQELGALRTPMLRLHLSEGNIVRRYEGGKTEKILFEEYDFPIISGGRLPGFVSKDSMKSSTFLKSEIDFRRRRIKELEEKKKTNDSEYKDLMRNLPKSELEYWTRYNTPIQVIIFIALGFCLGIKRGRGRSKSSGVTGFIVLISYYVLFFAGMSIAKKGTVAPWLAVMLPTILAGALFTFYYRRIDWRS